MWTAGERDELLPLHVSPALTAVLVVTVAGTLVFGLYPQALFDLAQVSAASLGSVPHVGLP
jgi:NADH:ubiquinone oxidoreductase subunit 2 (subunit N)